MGKILTTDELLRAHADELRHPTWDDPRDIYDQIAQDAPDQEWIEIVENEYVTDRIGDSMPCLLFIFDDCLPKLLKEAEAEDYIKNSLAKG